MLTFDEVLNHYFMEKLAGKELFFRIVFRTRVKTHDINKSFSPWYIIDSANNSFVYLRTHSEYPKFFIIYRQEADRWQGFEVTEHKGHYPVEVG